MTVRVSFNSSGVQGNAGSGSPRFSADGKLVAFTSCASNMVPNDTNGSCDVFIRNLATGEAARASVASNGSQANGSSSVVAFSPDGRYVVMDSDANNLVAGDTNDQPDVFIRDRATGQTTRVSVASDGSEANSYSVGGAISSDGRLWFSTPGVELGGRR